MDPLQRLRPQPGRRVLITAGAGGIGRSIADAFAATGAKLAICDVDGDAGHHRSHGLDVVVNNAGIAGPTGAIEDIDPADWQRTIDVDLNGQYHVAARTMPLLRQTGDGLLVNIASVAGRLGYAFRTPYAAAKWAVVGLTASLAKEAGPAGVRVNAILPGIVRGPRIERVIQARAEALGIAYADMEQRYLEKVSLRRMVGPEDVASMVLFLAAPGGRNISGQALSVCGNVEDL